MADSWEDWDDDTVLPVSSQPAAVPFDDEDEQQGFDGFVRHQPLQTLAELHPYYAAKHNDEPTVRIMKRQSPNETPTATSTSAPVWPSSRSSHSNPHCQLHFFNSISSTSGRSLRS